jgi:hypothetical protein
LVCCKKKLVGAGKGGSLNRRTGPAAAIEKPSGPVHRVTTKLTT